uniref:Retrovirus-related Pol polyprotein from transposon TNT 1-94 n=1 Tax=Cajanus cajan TaxID=3821 RepID=A0A151RH58_CAJCA|nr:hypothetical protein KK1_036792 [Cajanus cajan]
MNYRGMIGSLLYLTASKPDIMFNVCLYARCQFDPKKSHPKAVKRVFRYLAGPTNLGMFYEKHNNFTLAGFFDIDYVGDRGERKSTNGGCHSLMDSFHQGDEQTSIVKKSSLPRPR